MVIEFFGPPGAGKTTIARELASRLNKEYITVIGRREKFCYLLSYFFCSAWSAWRLVYLTWRESRPGGFLRRHKFSLLFNHLATAEKARRRGARATVVVDGGLAQYVLALYETIQSSTTLSNYAKSFVAASRLIFITAPAQLRQERMRERQRIPRTRLPIDHQKWQTVVARNAECLAAAWPVVSLETGRHSVAEVVQAIIEKI